MENNNTKLYLKKLLDKILVNDFTQQEIINFIAQITEQKDIDNENNLIIIEIIYLLKLQSQNLIPLIVLNLDNIVQRIIINNKIIDNKQSIEKNNEPKDWDINSADGFNKFREYQKKKYSPFSKEENPTLKFPKPGEKIDMQFIDDTSIPGRKFRSNVLIDHDGNIVEYLSGPTEICEAIDYNEIYSGLIGQIFDYQK